MVAELNDCGKMYAAAIIAYLGCRNALDDPETMNDPTKVTEIERATALISRAAEQLAPRVRALEMNLPISQKIYDWLNEFKADEDAEPPKEDSAENK